MANYCVKCGAALNPDSRFCPKCGAKVNDNLRTASNEKSRPVSEEPKRSASRVRKTNPETIAKQQEKPAGKGGAFTKLVIFVLIAALGFTGFVKPGFLRRKKDPDPYAYHYGDTSDSGSSSSSEGVHLAATGTLSPGSEKITLTASDCLVEEEVTFNVSPLNTLEDRNKGIKVYRYDITSDQITGILNGFMEIRIPYDDTFFDPGENPGDCLGVYTIDEKGNREPELFEVDTERKEVVIYAEHLSEKELFHYVNAPKAEKYDVNFGNTLVGNLSFEECMSVVTNFLNDYSAMDEAEKSYWADREAMSLIIASHFGTMLRIFPPDMNNYLNDASSWITNATTMLALGGEYEQAWLSNSIGSLSRLGLYTSLCKFSFALSDVSSPWRAGAPSREEVLNLYKTGFNTGLDYISSLYGTGSVAANVAMCMSGVFVFGMLIDGMFEEAMYQKMWDMAAVYEYFGDSYEGGEYRPRTNMEWYELFLDIFERYTKAGKQEYIEEAINREIYLYANRFWELSPDTVGEIVTAAGYKRMPYPTQAEIEKMRETYIENLTYRLTPVISQCEKTMLKRAEQNVLKWLKKAYNHLNYKVPLQICDGTENKIYAEYYFRYEGLYDSADLSIFQGQLDEEGVFDTSFCMNDWMQAGTPIYVSLYATEADMLKEKNAVARAQMVPAKSAKETTYVTFIEDGDELVWVMDEQVYQSYEDTYDTCSYEPRDNPNNDCGDTPGCIFVETCNEKTITCEEGACTYHTIDHGLYGSEEAETKEYNRVVKIPASIIEDAWDPKTYRYDGYFWFKNRHSDQTMVVDIFLGEENLKVGVTLKEAVPEKAEGEYFIFVSEGGKYGCRYRCVLRKDADKIQVSHVDAKALKYYGIDTTGGR